MSRSEDLAAARSAVRALEQAVLALRRQYGDGVDVRRLVADVSRLPMDLDLLGGTSQPAPSAARHVIDDRPYEHDFWASADSEGLGAADRHAF